MRILVIGLGKMGHLHASKISTLKPNADIFVLDHHLTASEITPYQLVTPSELPSVDIVIVATPTALHAEHIKLVLDQLDTEIQLLLVEKPFGIDSQERLGLLETLQERKIPVAVNSIEVLNPDVQALARSVQELKLQPRDIRCIRESKSNYDVDPLLDLGWHDLSVVFELFSNMATMRLTNQCERTLERGADSTTSRCNFQIMIDNTQRIHIDVLNRVYRPHAEITTLQRAIELDFTDWGLSLDFINGHLKFNGAVPEQFAASHHPNNAPQNDKLLALWEGLLRGVESGHFGENMRGFFRIKPIAEVYQAATAMNLVEPSE